MLHGLLAYTNDGNVHNTTAPRAEACRFLTKALTAGRVGVVAMNPETGVLSGGAETRRESYALGW